MPKQRGKRGQKPLRDSDGCDIREALFARHYVRLKGDAEKAARSAGYGGDLRHRACMLLKRSHVRAVIRRRTTEVLAALDMKADDVIRELSAIAFADVRKLFDDEGHLLNISALDHNTARAVSSFTNNEGKVAVQFWSKPKALAMLSIWLRAAAATDPQSTSMMKVNFLKRGESMKTNRDELLKDFGTAGLPDSDDPNINNTTGARVTTGESIPPFSHVVPEYRQPATNLPMQVSAAQIADQSRARTYNMDLGNRAPLAGTTLPESDNE